MPTQKWCSVPGCGNFIFATLEDFAENDWSAFKIPTKEGKLLCFCPQHQENMTFEMKKKLINKRNR